MPNCRHKGFSLVELLVVVSIVSTMATFALPNMALFKIRASRAEMQVQMRGLFTAAHAWHAENGAYGRSLVLGHQSYGPIEELNDGYDTPDVSGCRASDIANSGMAELGMTMTAAECQRLRYAYSYSPSGGWGNSTDGTLTRYFTIVAQSRHVESTDGGIIIHYGAGPPTGMCMRTSGFVVRYMDTWTMYETGTQQPYPTAATGDALKNCFY